MNSNEEYVLKVIGKATLELNLEIKEQGILRDCMYFYLHNYEINTIDRALTISDLSEKVLMYLQVKKIEGYSDLTLKNYMYTLRKFTSLINKNVNDVTKNDIRYFLITDGKDKKPSSQNSTMYYIKGFFNWLEEEEIIEKNPIKKMKMNKLPKRLRKSLTITELEQVRNACKDRRDRALVEFLSSTGCRVSELISINKQDINFNNNSIKIIGKGNKERIIFFNEKTKMYLMDYIEYRNDNNEALFVSKKIPFDRLGRRGVETIISKIGKESKIGKPLFPHLLRHTMATLGHKAGADITTIQHLLGHSSPVTTQVYAEESIENLQYEYNKNITH